MRAGDDFPRERRLFRRRTRHPSVPRPDRDQARAMKEFVRTRSGVEAYVEPRTLHQQPSVVLVASDGEWLRFSVPSEATAEKFARKHAIPLYDAARVGYPRRMRDYRRGT